MSNNAESPTSSDAAHGSATDGTTRLCLALYQREPRAADWIGGSEAKMLHDAAAVVEAARCIRHWHDRDPDGMVVSAEHVRKLWDTLSPNVESSPATVGGKEQ